LRVNYRSNGHPIVDSAGIVISNDEALTQAIVSGILNHLLALKAILKSGIDVLASIFQATIRRLL
jgi:hypothetical protein